MRRFYNPLAAVPASWISTIAHPFAMVALMVVVPAMRHSSGHAVQLVILVALAIVVPIAPVMGVRIPRDGDQCSEVKPISVPN